MLKLACEENMMENVTKKMGTVMEKVTTLIEKERQ